eukprot:CAMPEP_0177412172 /NCGR_PEP_ID=MMETSP0368-20130122/65846_1 /TAXON_ID=447022 ORGANISM="Scrippsiella hangoei-like, Strain SHHI-4" /NCGR_SAMPLE_ID=MMETSP0368 /ASSEMBLY_ACC=CAM_ASM_000363 /LENGTH=125 /DNA_ID=CAMNT_0018881411 /DNA_START=790 /DNA_END=1163 /DNA_ORIENTATION=+
MILYRRHERADLRGHQEIQDLACHRREEHESRQDVEGAEDHAGVRGRRDVAVADTRHHGKRKDQALERRPALDKVEDDKSTDKIDDPEYTIHHPRPFLPCRNRRRSILPQRALQQRPLLAALLHR